MYERLDHPDEGVVEIHRSAAGTSAGWRIGDDVIAIRSHDYPSRDRVFAELTARRAHMVVAPIGGDHG